MKKIVSVFTIALIAATACEKSKSKQRLYEVNSTTSVAEWKGAAPDHFHVGSFAVKGSLTAEENGAVKDGSFLIPIASIQDFDLQDPDIKKQLLDHLKSPDFFNMAVHPNAEFKISKIEPYAGNDEDAVANANKLVTGNFSMVGQTHPITFPARINTVGDSLKVEATLKIDRTKWGMTKYTDPASPEYIIPDADIHLKMQAARK